jgi:hypothetical protein
LVRVREETPEPGGKQGDNDDDFSERKGWDSGMGKKGDDDDDDDYGRGNGRKRGDDNDDSGKG